ncbi:MAG: DUF3560 domain-containing protein [Alphaproteobacteria bacterium]|nr:DUF3560 domain-containing protein [Alphaproteobacteria bacterium]MBQ3946346.1 DUF3560 domain-containing protein [Alphaproteobacteria bacterium]
MEKTNLILNSAIEIKDNNELEGKGKGRLFISKFIEPGVAHYEQFGDVLITKETLDKFIQSMVGCPVIIKHKDITDENVDKERVGVVSKVWYSEFDGWYWCEGILWDKQAIDLVKNQGWNVSCTYDFESDKQPKTHNGKKIDMEFTGGEFLHLALVDNPRYERANIVVNSCGDTVENDKWITVKPNGEDEKGRHLLIKDGEDIGDAMRRQWGVQVKGQQHLFDAKKYKLDTNYKEDLHKRLQEHLKSIKPEKDNTKHYGKKEHQEEIISLYEGLKNPDKSEARLKEDRELLEHHLKELNKYPDTSDTYISLDETDRENKIKEIKKELGQNIKKRDVKPEDIGLKDEGYYEPDMEETYTKSFEDNIKKDFEEFKKAQKEAPKELSEHEKIFGEGVEVQEHDRKGNMVDSKNLKSYKKGDRFAIVDDWSHDDKDRFTVSFHEGKKRINSKTYSTKKGMEKAIREHLQGGPNKEQKALATKTNLEDAQARYKDVLSKYNKADRTRWKSGLTNEEYHKAWVDAEKYKKELTVARREYAESIMSNFEAQEHTAYDDKITDKKMRYEEMAAKTQAESDRMAKQSLDMISAIPMGQPILVGHHSEMRDRRYRQRAWDKMDKAYQLSKKSDYYADKAGSVGTAGISADDANAIAKLAQKYQSGVDSAEKRRIIDRVIDLHTRATSTKPESEQTDYGFSIERNKDINRLQLKFDNIPDANTRAVLKSNGFRWSPKEKAWQRQLNGNSERSLKYVMEKMKAENALLEGIEDILTEHTVSVEDLPLLEGLHNILKD